MDAPALDAVEALGVLKHRRALLRVGELWGRFDLVVDIAYRALGVVHVGEVRRGHHPVVADDRHEITDVGLVAFEAEVDRTLGEILARRTPRRPWLGRWGL